MFTTLMYNEHIEDYTPYSQESIERTVLGIILEAPENITSNVCASTTIECFTNLTYKKLYKIISDYISKNGYSDLSVEAIEMFYFGEDNKVIDLKIAELLAELANECVNFSAWRNWVKWLHQSYEARLFAQCKTAKDFEAAKEKISSLAIKESVGIPVKFIGLGEGVNDLRAFDIEDYIYGLFKDMM